MSADVKIGGNTYNGVSKVVLKNTSNADVTFTLEDEQTALYALGDYSRSDNVNIKISNKNRVRLEFNSNLASMLINLRHLIATINNSNIMNEDKWFTIPAGQCEFKITNVVNENSIGYLLNFAIAGTTTTTSEFSTGRHFTSEDISISLNNQTSIDVGAIVVSITSPTAGSVLEFDVEFTADGVRYI